MSAGPRVRLRARTVERGRRRAPAGFTLVEIMTAFMLLSVGLLAIAGLAATATRSVRGGSAQTRAAAIAQSRFDSLASHSCDQIRAAIPAGQPAVSGTATTRGITESWTARMESSNNMVRVTDALTIKGRTATYHYVSLRACR